LRNTPETLLMQRGVPVWEAAGGMSAEVLLGTYGHHHPDFLHGAASVITAKHWVSVVETVVGLESVRRHLTRHNRSDAYPVRMKPLSVISERLLSFRSDINSGSNSTPKARPNEWMKQ
jgi:hypothetical protein